MYNIWSEITHDSCQAAQEKLKTRIQSACHMNLALETLGPRKILVESANGAYSVFEALTAQSLYDFQDPYFCASHPQTINNMQHAQPRSVGLPTGSCARRPPRAILRAFCRDRKST